MEYKKINLTAKTGFSVKVTLCVIHLRKHTNCVYSTVKA